MTPNDLTRKNQHTITYAGQVFKARRYSYGGKEYTAANKDSVLRYLGLPVNRVNLQKVSKIKTAQGE
ncbi:MAG: hypothetical protein AB7V08_08730 [Elusimicrobiales bacterium]